MEVFDLHVYLLAVFRQLRCELVNDDPRGQGIVFRLVANMLTLVINLAKFLMDHPRPVPKTFLTHRVLSVELRAMPPKAAPSPASSSDVPESSFHPSCLFPTALSASSANQATRVIFASTSQAISLADLPVWVHPAPPCRLLGRC
jgi:hypothetical protein